MVEELHDGYEERPLLWERLNHLVHEDAMVKRHNLMTPLHGALVARGETSTLYVLSPAQRQKLRYDATAHFWPTI